MKNLSFMLLLCFSLVVSCTKTDNIIEKIDENAITSVMQLKTNAQIKNAYNLLNSSEKVELWKRHFDFFIESNDLTSEQKSFIVSLKEQWLKNDLFDQSSKRFQEFNLALTKIKYTTTQLFGVSDTYSLLFDLTLYKSKYKIQNNSVEQYGVISSNSETEEEFGESNSCKCSRTDSYCNAGSCVDNGCNSSGFGCGTLWIFSCNGVCRL